MVVHDYKFLGMFWPSPYVKVERSPSEVLAESISREESNGWELIKLVALSSENSGIVHGAWLRRERPNNVKQRLDKQRTDKELTDYE